MGVPCSGKFIAMSMFSAAPRSRWVLPVFYAVLLLGGILGVMLIRAIGETEVAGISAISLPTASPKALPASAKHVLLLHVLGTLVAVIVVGRLFAALLKPLGQPAVIGEILAGIALGPSLLGMISPDAMHLLIPDAAADPQQHVVSALSTIAQLGIVLYMFVVGLELNTSMLAKSAHAAVAISHASIIVPFVSGCALSLWLYEDLARPGIPFTSFALFLGVAMAITAFPVLARILTDRKLEATPLGVISLSCAASDDVTAWCLLAFVLGVAQSQIDSAFWVLLYTGIYLLIMFTFVRPLAIRLLPGPHGRLPAGRIAWLFAAVLVSALTTEIIGIHAIFGGFLMGVIIPHDSPVATAVKNKLHDVVTMLFLPAFFAMSGMNTQIGLISGWENWLICIAIIAVATFGKYGGTYLAARLAGLNHPQSSALGVLMNTRGLMELIVLNIGLSMGIISETLYAMMVLMALATTMMTGPLIHLIWPKPESPTQSDSPPTVAVIQ